MDKQWYQLTFKPLQPLHIGMGTYGVLSPTNIYIPGKVMWGALTRALGEKLGWNKDNLNEEQKGLFTEISNFYPVVDKGEISFPKYEKGEFHLGNFSEKKFRYYFTDTFISTAINSDSQSAKDESLHEMELLLPRSKEDKPKELLWKGILSVNLDDEIHGNNGNKVKLSEFLNPSEISEIRVGGEQKYGYGLMKLIAVDDKNYNEAGWNLENGKIVFADNKTSVHNVNENSLPKVIMGEQEIWYETKANAQKRLSLGSPKRVFRPGCKVQGSNELKLYKGVILKSE